MDDLELAIRRAPITAVDSSTRTVSARLVTWNDPRTVVDPDGSRYRETFAPGALVPNHRTYVLDEHHGTLIGHMDGHRDDGSGHVADLHIADTTAGRDLMALVDAGSLTDVSIEFDQRGGDAQWNATRSAVTRTRAPLHGVAFVFRPAHTAPIIAVREDEPPVNETPLLPAPTVQELKLEMAADDVLAFRSEMVGIRDELAAMRAAGVHPLARFSSFAEYVKAAGEDRLLSRALADQITTNNPGVIPPGWLTDVKGIVIFGRPAISAVGAAPLPAAGMDINWPYYDGDLTTLVGIQATQKTAITSVRLDLKKGTKALSTFAGGSDISYQLVRRSDPSYLASYMRLMAAGYSAVTDKQFLADLDASGTGTGTLDPAAATAATLRAALFAGSMAVMKATGRPATAVIVDDVWLAKMGGLDGLWPAAYGTFNTTGTADASTLRVTVSGLAVTYDPYCPAGKMIVTNSAAAQWHEDGPMVATHEDVEKLGHDVAVWGLGATAVYVPAGVVVISATGTE